MLLCIGLGRLCRGSRDTGRWMGIPGDIYEFFLLQRS